MLDRIAILGTGLLGTSAGLALREAGFRGGIVGWNRTAEQARLALQMGAIDSVAADPIAAARESQTVLLAMPIYATLDWMEKLAPALGPEHLVTDVGSTKRLITEAATRLYNAPERAAFLPGHPMAGKERGGASLAEASLFRGAAWLFTPASGETVSGHDFSRAENAAPSTRALAPAGISPTGAALIREWREWVAKMGAKTLDLDATRHDELVAWVSHLPQFLATALSALLEEKVGDAPELRDVGGRALREMTRLGSSPYSMWRDIAYTNTEAVEKTLAALEQRIADLRENLRTPGLRDEFEQANKFRRE